MKNSPDKHKHSSMIQLYVDAVLKQLDALRHSARWRIGHRVISLIERVIGRKKIPLAIDHIEHLLQSLSNKANSDIKKAHERSRHHNLKSRVNTSHKIQTCGFIVSHASSGNNAQGDIFVAQELAEACATTNDWKCELIDSENISNFGKNHFNVVVSLLFNFDMSKFDQATYKIAWVRSYAEHWVMKPWFNEFELVLCASFKIQAFIEEVTDKKTFLFPIATNPDHFKNGIAKPEYACDYCFNGNSWAETRDIETYLNPQDVPYKFKIFGRGWENHAKFSAYHAGLVNYSNMANVYASTELVIDDANTSTEKWESVNSRVFDALGQGLKLITNSPAACQRLFNIEPPSYVSKEDLNGKIAELLSDRRVYIDELSALQQTILKHHTYDNRSDTLNSLVERELGSKYYIVLKISPLDLVQGEEWGDFHFATSLAKSFERWGHKSRIDFRKDWYENNNSINEINLVIQGIHSFNPIPNALNILWIISHPEKLDLEILQQYDYVFVASEKYAKIIKSKVSIPVDILLQCTDPETFHPASNTEMPKYDKLYVANSRDQKRLAVQYALDENIQLDVVGNGWSKMIPESWIKQNYVANDMLKYLYSSADVVVVDHWDDMRASGFISNRIFDILACGGNILSDQVDGLDELFDGIIDIYQDRKSFSSKVQESKKALDSLDARQAIADHHTFDHRAASLLDGIEQVKSMQKFI